MPLKPESLDWPEERAILFVHGVGNARQGDYDPLVKSVKQLLGNDADKFAFYFLYYDFINDWFAEKTRLASGISKLKDYLKISAGGNDVADIFAEFAGDVIWPVLSEAARLAIREHYLAQVKQLVLDGMSAGVPPYDQKVSIICHSLGCFHTYEILHAMADESFQMLTPATDGITFRNVIYMASPVQLIRSAAGKIKSLIPGNKPKCLDKKDLFCPYEEGFGFNVYSTRNWISITGNMDPVGGYLFKNRQNWAYMQVDQPDDFPGQESIVDDQSILDIKSKKGWINLLKTSLSEMKPPEIPLSNPHSWEGYIDRHKKELKTWLTA